jgi:hypothetical protein
LLTVSQHNFPDGGDPEQFCKRYEARFIRQLPEYGSAPHGTPRTHNWNKDNLDNIVWYSKNMHNWTERSKQTAFFEDFKEVVSSLYLFVARTTADRLSTARTLVVTLTRTSTGSHSAATTS